MVTYLGSYGAREYLPGHVCDRAGAPRSHGLRRRGRVGIVPFGPVDEELEVLEFDLPAGVPGDIFQSETDISQSETDISQSETDSVARSPR